ncbi:EAL domain-containing protein [Rhodoferax aquaticus]|uniref:protein-glutamate O-methyltransferase n=2 Tax=Rhodoferax aquaticus TaxID=2527691 RepID=A0A515EW26_9BURK|nr:EAL domain-containing protein [Rhodoferax aquaticus]
MILQTSIIDKPSASSNALVVAIGSSAGGLEALSQLVAGLPQKLGCVYVIAQHMSPTHRSMMAEILARETTLPVREIVEEETPVPDVIYIIPPGRNMVFAQGQFLLSTPSPEVAPKPSVNLLFQSMAEEFEERAVGIILSGTGSDGTKGLRAIKSAGGVTFVQMPETAKYEGMPRSAIDARVADHILSPEQMGRELERLVQFPSNPSEFENTEQRPAEFSDLFERVRQRTKIDFSRYKLATVQRRLQRRMASTGRETLADYLAYTDEHPEELDALAKEALISVTEFYRDKEAFDALEHSAREIIDKKQAGERLRIWVVACATGEEAYSLGVMFLELLSKSDKQLSLQVYATDIDNDALAIARRGIYNRNSMEEMPADLVDRYFTRSGNGFEPVKALRDCVTFARQDITSDPPFLRMDLVTCRNVMIYFKPELQAKVLSIIRYALRDDGLLFLGRSETVRQQEGLFSVVDRRARIFRSRGESHPVSMGKTLRGSLRNSPTPAMAAGTPYERMFLRTLAEQFGPAVLIDTSCRILHSHGNVGQLIHFPTGAPDLNLAALIAPELASEVLITLHRAQRKHSPAYSRNRRIASLNGAMWRLAIVPAADEVNKDLFLVHFQPATLDSKDKPTHNGTSDRLTQSRENEDALELASTREHLQALMEEIAASNEEMQALNEEVQASNEELQASNEELEASNEELQATNEELVSVNDESQAKTTELAAVNVEFEGVYNTIDFPIVVFDTNLCLRRLNGSAVRSYDLAFTAVGQPFGRLKFPNYLDGIDKRLSEALRTGKKEAFPTAHEDRRYQVFVTPVLSPVGMSQGVVLVVVDNTELIDAQQQISESQERLLAIMNHSVSVVTLKDTSGRYEFVNQRFEEIFNLGADAVIGKTDHQVFGKDIADALRDHDFDAMRQLDAVESVDKVPLANGAVWLESVRFPVFDRSGAVRSVCLQANDISRKHHADEQLRLAAKVFDRAGEAIVITDASATIITVNDAFTHITGYALADVIGKKPSILKSGQHSPDFYAEMWRSLNERGSWQGEIFNCRKNGEVAAEWLTINSVRDENHGIVNYVSIFSDIKAIQSSQRRIEFLATHDELTGLPNRSLLVDRLKHAISNAKRQRKKLAVLFVDLDNFKNINDTLGHDVGDLLLVQATERLHHCVRDSDTLARLGGDEFVAVLGDITLPEVNAIAQRIVSLLAAPFRANEQSLFVTASIGISMYPDDGVDSVNLLKSADTAMYRAKERGRNQFQFFEEEMKVLALQRLTLETGLRMASDAKRFRMVYQPKVDMNTGELVGAEALLRWSDPTLGDISPGQFIPIAEASGLMVAIGDQVFAMVLAQIASWRAAGLAVPKVAINVSTHQLREPKFVENVATWLSQSGLPAESIGIELTESSLMERPEVMRAMLLALKKLGLTLSVDDFGTGYSSLAYLRKFPVDELKIDRSFVDGIATEQDDRAVARTVITMAHSLGLRVVAEGVETVEQSQVLREERCVVAQGYLYHRPLQVDAFSMLLKTTAIK